MSAHARASMKRGTDSQAAEGAGPRANATAANAATGSAEMAETFTALRQFVQDTLGIKMPPAKVPLLQSRLQSRIRALGLGSLPEYRDYLFASPEAARELVQFIDAVTTNKTDFWREANHFEFLASRVLPEVVAHRQHASSEPRIPLRGGFGVKASSSPSSADDKVVKVWCAGCSSGEEPYTLAMTVDDFGRDKPTWDYRILATDISSKVLAHAKQGIYDAERVEPLPPHLRNRYVMRAKDRSKNVVRIVPRLRSRIAFHRLNFMDKDYGVSDVFDAVFFRNVAIYFDGPTQEAVVNRLCKNLRPGGYFFMGQSESLAGANVPLRHVGPSIYVRT
jgi:chemotaxis protein methyltransferase CheR